MTTSIVTQARSNGSGKGMTTPETLSGATLGRTTILVDRQKS